MRLKVALFSRKVVRSYMAIVAVLSAIASFFFIAFDVPNHRRVPYIIAAVVLFIALYLVIWIRANFVRSSVLNINGSVLEVKIGDLFQQDGLKAVAFNEYFDTLVDDRVISQTSLNGLYLSKYDAAGIRDLNDRINRDARLKDNVVASNVTRRVGKKTQYKLGSVFLDNDFMLVAFSRFDADNRAVLSLKEYVECLIGFWDEVDRVYAGRSVAVPLMGAGITRFKDAEVQPTELLNMLIWTFKISRVKFKHPAKVTIVVHDSMISKVNFYELSS